MEEEARDWMGKSLPPMPEEIKKAFELIEEWLSKEPENRHFVFYLCEAMPIEKFTMIKLKQLGFAIYGVTEDKEEAERMIKCLWHKATGLKEYEYAEPSAVKGQKATGEVLQVQVGVLLDVGKDEPITIYLHESIYLGIVNEIEEEKEEKIDTLIGHHISYQEKRVK